MTTKQDPYARLLGLPPGPRPPHLYALLGLEPFCDDLAAILEASRRQMACVKPYEDHPESAFRAKVQDIMNQIGLARAVLRDPNKKAEYDRRLADLLSEKPSVPVSPGRSAAGETRPASPPAPSQERALNLDAPPEPKKSRRVLTLNIVETVSGSSSTVRLSPETESILGRNDDCAVCIEHVSVSPRHARLTYRQGRWYVSREDRTAEILVNGQRCTQALLAHGDSITVGAYEIHVELE